MLTSLMMLELVVYKDLMAYKDATIQKAILWFIV